jgi:hypothetical protein
LEVPESRLLDNTSDRGLYAEGVTAVPLSGIVALEQIWEELFNYVDVFRKKRGDLPLTRDQKALLRKVRLEGVYVKEKFRGPFEGNQYYVVLGTYEPKVNLYSVRVNVGKIEEDIGRKVSSGEIPASEKERRVLDEVVKHGAHEYEHAVHFFALGASPEEADREYQRIGRGRGYLYHPWERKAEDFSHGFVAERYRGKNFPLEKGCGFACGTLLK